jgi:hypothetical protein
MSCLGGLFEKGAAILQPNYEGRENPRRLAEWKHALHDDGRVALRARPLNAGGVLVPRTFECHIGRPQPTRAERHLTSTAVRGP